MQQSTENVILGIKASKLKVWFISVHDCKRNTTRVPERTLGRNRYPHCYWQVEEINLVNTFSSLNKYSKYAFTLVS